MLNSIRSAFSSMPKHTYNGPTLATAIAASQHLPTSSATENAIFANGCFWGTEHEFRKFLGPKLIDAKVGYTGGQSTNPSYKQVCSGTTNHAESVKLTYDPSKISYAELVEFHFRMHDPTTVDRQGGDRGTQYRSAIFTFSDEQDSIARKVMAEVQAAHYPNDKIATKIEPAGQWWDAEDYHQEYLTNTPGGYTCPTHKLWW